MRKLWPLPGGIQPPQNKAQSTACPIAHAGLPEQLLLPLVDARGAALEIAAQLDQPVLKGDLIARPTTDHGVPLHAPTSGRLVGPMELLLPNGTTAPGLILIPDGLDQWRPRQPRDAAMLDGLDPASLLTIIRDAGIAGMGGAGFSAAAKLAATQGHAIDLLIINGVECEPYITADDLLMRERAAEVIAGVEILQRIVLPQRETLVAIEDNKPAAIAAMTAAAAGKPIEIVAVPTRYPAGGERQLIQILTGKEVPSGALPAAIGVSCHNVATAAAVERAVVRDEPLIQRIVTVTGGACSRPRNFEALIGTRVSHLLALAGHDTSRSAQLIMGGPLMGATLASAEVPIGKGSNCVIAATAAELPPPAPPQPCIRCGYCADACPVDLLPQQLHWYGRAGNLDELSDHHLPDCIECGACTWVCPSSIPLVEEFRHSKQALRERSAEQAAAARAKQRFDARNARIARDEAERAARRQARLAALKAQPATDAHPENDAQPHPNREAPADHRKPHASNHAGDGRISSGQSDAPSRASGTLAGSAATPADDKAAAIRAAVERARARKQQKAASPSEGEQS